MNVQLLYLTFDIQVVAFMNNSYKIQSSVIFFYGEVCVIWDLRGYYKGQGFYCRGKNHSITKPHISISLKAGIRSFCNRNCPKGEKLSFVILYSIMKVLF